MHDSLIFESRELKIPFHVVNKEIYLFYISGSNVTVPC